MSQWSVAILGFVHLLFIFIEQTHGILRYRTIEGATGRSGMLFDPETYKSPHPRVLNPAECYRLPPVDELQTSDLPGVEETADD